MAAEAEIKALITRAKTGDEQAIAALYERHVERIYRYIAYRVPDEEAEDLTAEVFLRMVDGIKEFEYTGAPFEAWLYRIASARVSDFYRRNQRENQEIPETIQDPHLQPEEFLQKQQEMTHVRWALQQLSEDEQNLLILRFVERLHHKEVAVIMGKSEGAIRTMQHRALLRLADLLEVSGKERHYLRGENQPPMDT